MNMRDRVVIYILMGVIIAGAVLFTVALNKGWLNANAWVVFSGARRK